MELGPDGFGIENAPADTALLCGAVVGAGICGAPATIHGWQGSPPDTRGDFTVYCCDEHQIRPDVLWDFHRVETGACGIPGARWLSGEYQGQGRCLHEIGGSLG